MPKKATKKKTQSASNKLPAKNIKSSKAVIEGPRKLKVKSKRKWRLQLRTKPDRVKRKPIPSAYKLFESSLKILKDHWLVFFGILFIYAFLNLLLAKGFAPAAQLSTLKNSLSELFHGNARELVSGAGLFAVILGGFSNSSLGTTDGSTYQAALIFGVSLALVWTLRHAYSNKPTTIRDGYYKGMYPLVPVLVVLMVIAFQLIPFVIGTALFSAVIGGGIAISIFEKIVVFIVCAAIALISLYWLCGSLFALYIATLPDMTPMRALRSARELVFYRRLKVFSKILFLPIAIAIIAAIIMTPIILFITPLAAMAFFIISAITLAVFHSYMYTTYRAML